MYCPKCGQELVEIGRPEMDVYDFLGNYISSYKEEDLSKKYICNNCKCFGPGYELVMHHPLCGMKSAPGDSWSLTWLK